MCGEVKGDCSSTCESAAPPTQVLEHRMENYIRSSLLNQATKSTHMK